ncbi:cyclic nucleotide-binding domain-containing protein [Candidatus Omnitrophota bacterium]
MASWVQSAQKNASIIILVFLAPLVISPCAIFANIDTPVTTGFTQRNATLATKMSNAESINLSATAKEITTLRIGVNAYIEQFQQINKKDNTVITYGLDDDTLPFIVSIIADVAQGMNTAQQQRCNERVIENPAVLAKLCLIWEHAPFMLGKQTNEEKSELINELLQKYVTDDEVARYVEENLGKETYDKIMNDAELFAIINLVYDVYKAEEDLAQKLREIIDSPQKPTESQIAMWRQELQHESHPRVGWSTFFDHKALDPHCVGDKATFSPIAYIKNAYREGIQHIELSTDFLPFDPDKRLPHEIDAKERARIKATAQLYGITLTLHSPLVGPQNPKTGFKSLLEDPADNVTIQKQAVDLGEDIGAKVLVVHIVNKSDISGYVEIVKHAAGKNVRVGLENTYDQNKVYSTAREHLAAFKEIMLRLNNEAPNAISNASLLIDASHLNLTYSFEDPMLFTGIIKDFAQELADELDIAEENARETFISQLISEVHLNQNIGPMHFFSELELFSADYHSTIDKIGSIHNQAFIASLFYQGFKPLVLAEQSETINGEGKKIISTHIRAASDTFSFQQYVAEGEKELGKYTTGPLEKIMAFLMKDDAVKKPYHYMVGRFGINDFLSHIMRRLLHMMINAYCYSGDIEQVPLQEAFNVELLEIKKGTRIIHQGDTDKSFYLIVEGRVEVNLNNIKLNKPIILEAGFFIGEGNVLGEETTRTANVDALTDVKVIKIEVTDVKIMQNFFPEFKDFLLQIATQRKNETAQFPLKTLVGSEGSAALIEQAILQAA